MKKSEQSLPLDKRSFREIRYEEKKRAIVINAAKAFAKKGFDSTTIEEIAHALKMTKGSFYYYFKNKEEILYQAQLFSLKAGVKVLTQINKSSEPPEIKLRNAVIQNMKRLFNDFEGSLILQQYYALPENYQKDIHTLRDLYEAQFIQILKEGIKAKKYSVKNIKMAAYCMFGAMNWFLRWYKPSGRLTIEEIGNAFIDFFFYGLLTRKPSEKEIIPTFNDQLKEGNR
jgi:AcrR family transcriptional regulator